MADGHDLRSTRLIAYSIVSIFLLLAINPILIAEARPVDEGGKGNRIVSKTETVRIDAPEDIEWNVKQNIANVSDDRFLDYNLTWNPFFENNSDIQGILIHNLFAPALTNLNVTDQSISTGSFFRLTPDQIMDGVSECWFRLPVTDIPDNATISVRVWRTMDPFRFNMTYHSFYGPTFARYEDMLITYNITETSSQWSSYRRDLSILVPETNGSFYYNFTYLKGTFGMFPNEWYFLEFDIWAPYADSMQLALASGDFGCDSRNNSWLWVNGTDYYLPLDLDTPFVCTYGVSNGITGIGVNVSSPGAEYLHFKSWIPIQRTISVTTGRVYFNVLFPFLINTSLAPEVQVNCSVYFCYADATAFAYNSSGPFETYNATYNFFLRSFNLTTSDGKFIDHILLDFIIHPDTPYEHASEAVKLWGVQRTFDDKIGGYTDLYWKDWIPTPPPPGAGHWETNYAERQWFIPFGSYSLDNSYWTNENMSIAVIPIKTPRTPQHISEALQDFTAYLEGQDKNGNGTLLYQRFRAGIDFIWGKVGDLWDVLSPVRKALHWYVEQVANLGFWWFEKTFLWFSPWFHFWKWGQDQPGGWPGIFDRLKAIGQFLLDVVELLFNALEWFTYWAVKTIYSVSIAIVYMVNVFGVISINSALLAVAKSGNGKDFVKAFRAGWRFVFAIISLLLSLAIMAIAIVGAVVPF